MSTPSSTGSTGRLSTRISTAAQEGLAKTLAQFQNAGINMRSVLKQGDAWDAILETAKELGAGMIVMGTHGRTGIGRALLGSVAAASDHRERSPR